jgi:hypothetical protein
MSYLRSQSPQTSFEKFYHLFLRNSMLGEPYRILLENGEVADGSPSAGSIVDPRSKDASFLIRLNDGKTSRVPFRVLKTAIPLRGKQASVRSGGIDLWGGSDFYVSLSAQESEVLYEVETGEVEILAAHVAGPPFVSGANQGTYRNFIFVNQKYPIKGISELAKGVLRLCLMVET